MKRYLHADGHIVWVDLSVALLRDGDGTPIHFICQILDMSAQHDSQAQLADAQATIDHQRRMAEAVFDTVDIGLLLIDRDGALRADEPTATGVHDAGVPRRPRRHRRADWARSSPRTVSRG